MFAATATFVSSAGLAAAAPNQGNGSTTPPQNVANSTAVEVDALTVSHGNVDGQTLGLTLPGQQSGSAPVNAAEVPDGLFLGNGAPLANAVLESSTISTYKTEEGSQSLIKIDGPSAPQEFRFPLDLPEGASAVVTSIGGVAITSSDGVLMGGVSAPWAIDASGSPVVTSLSVEGRTLVQTVNTVGAKFPVVADPSIQWIPYPVIALYGSQATAIAQTVASGFVVLPGSACTLVNLAGWMGKVFAMICSVVGLGAAKDVFTNLGRIWNSGSNLNASGCYGFQVWNIGATPANLPARDCSW